MSNFPMGHGPLHVSGNSGNLLLATYVVVWNAIVFGTWAFGITAGIELARKVFA